MKRLILIIVRALRADTPSLLAVSRLGAAGISLISAPIVARAIGPDGRGETAAAIALFSLVPVLLGGGVPTEVRRRAATSEALTVVGGARLLAVVSLIPAFGAAILVNATLLSGLDATSRLIAFIGICLAPLVVAWLSDISVLVAHARYRVVFAMQLLQPVVYLAGVVAVSVSGFASTASVLAVYLAGTMAPVVVGLIVVRCSFRGSLRVIPELFRGGFRFAGSSLAEAASNRLDQAIALPLLGATQAGFYAVATTLVGMPLALGQALGATYFRSTARAPQKQRNALRGQAARSSLALSLAAYCLLCALSPIIIPILFGAEFWPTVPVVWVLSIGGAAMTTAYVLSQVLAAEGRGVAMSVSQVLALAVATSALLILAPSFAAEGAAVASSLGYIVLGSLLGAVLKLKLPEMVPRPSDLVAAVRRLIGKD